MGLASLTQARILVRVGLHSLLKICSVSAVLRMVLLLEFWVPVGYVDYPYLGSPPYARNRLFEGVEDWQVACCHRPDETESRNTSP